MQCAKDMHNIPLSLNGNFSQLIWIGQYQNVSFLGFYCS